MSFGDMGTGEGSGAGEEKCGGMGRRKVVGIIRLNGRRCERWPLVYFNSRCCKRRSLKIFKID